MSAKRIYVIGKAWSPRALIRAQLLEEGFDVTALETIDDLRRELKRRIKYPDLIIVDYSDTRLDPAMLEPLRALNARAPILLCISGSDREQARSAGLRFLARPFSVGAVIEQVRALLTTGQPSQAPPRAAR